jgi:hypothetical protein
MRDILFILLVLFLIIIAAVVPVLLVLGPQLDLELIVPQINVTAPQQEEPAGPLYSPDMERYFALKNKSCQTLSGDFLIVTNDYSNGKLQDLLPATDSEEFFAQNLDDEYDFNLTTKTYLRGDQMKKVISSNGVELTTIWKSGRIYTCTAVCSMKLMDEEDSEEYYSKLNEVRNSCHYLGKTELPESVDPGRLLVIDKKGLETINGYRCEKFWIYGNQSYIDSMNRSSLDPDQEAIVWALEHLEGPLVECLDESTGIIVKREFALDLTDYYDLEFDAGGYLQVEQTTELTYFTSTVPEEFLALPDN